jgi:predicted permease
METVMAGLLQDVRLALRQLRKKPGFTISAVVMLAVAICANSTMLSWINGTMLHPIPGSRDTDRLVSVMRGQWSTSPTPPFSYLDYRDLRDQNHSFVGMLAYHHDWSALTGGVKAERIYSATVSSNYFEVLGIHPLLGRFFRPEEEARPDAVPLVVLGYSLWKTRYAGDPAIVGKAIEISRHPVTVIGVAPKGFTGAMPSIRQDVWLTLNPIGSNDWLLQHRSADFLNVIAKLRPGVTREQAQQDLDILMRKIVAAYPDDHLGSNTIALDPMWRSPFGGNVYMASSLPILLGIAGVVLLLTCANVATLTLVRFVARRREIAIRQSLGAGRMQLARQMVLEGGFVSLCSGALALLLTVWTARSFARFIPPNANPTLLNGLLDSNVILGIALLTLVASALCGALPAWRSSQVSPTEALKEESANLSGGSRNRRLLSGLVVTQIALSLALLVSSGLFLQTLRNLALAQPGFEQDHILTVSVGLNLVGYPAEQRKVIRNKILDQVSVLPGVRVVSLTDWVPMSWMRKTVDAYPEGYVPAPHESLEVRTADVSPRYFATLGIPITEGRDFTRDDNEKSPRVLIIDQTTAHRYWPGQDALGKRLRIGGSLFTVVGLVRNTKHAFMYEQPEPMVYMSYFQRANELIVQVKTQGDPLNMIPAVEGAIQSIDDQLPVYDVRTMRQATEGGSAFAVIESTFAGVFAVIALVLSATGIYGVVAYRTQLRTHEIGIRVALGATRLDVLKLILIQGLWLTLCGLSVGLALAFTLTRAIAAQLYGVSANDPMTIFGVVLLLGAMSVLACYLPARRAMQTNPVSAIREL